MRTGATRLLVACLGVTTWAPAAEGQIRWRPVAQEVSFEIRNAGLPVRGTFEDLEVEIAFDPAAPSSATIVGRIDPASVKTGITMRDRHLAGRQFFDVRRFPLMEMRAMAIEAADRPGAYRGHFEVVVRDVTKVVPVAFRFERVEDRATLSGSMTIDRVEFGVGDGGFLLGSDVTVTVVLELERDGDQGDAPPV